MDALGEHHRESEQRARLWLKEIVPTQAEVYERFGFIEIPSRLYKDRTYRIYGGEGDFRTSLYQNGRKIARLCMAMTNPDIPPTDRVIAEYFLLRNDERHYLDIANIQTLVGSHESRTIIYNAPDANHGATRASDSARASRWVALFALVAITVLGIGMGLLKFGYMPTVPKQRSLVIVGALILLAPIVICYIAYILRKHTPR
jgi:hypothetical protein